MTDKANTIAIGSEMVSLGELRALWLGGRGLELTSERYSAIDASACSVGAKIEAGERIYGVSTGYGSLSNTTVDGDRLLDLQRNVVLSCMAGTGDPLSDATVRLVLAIKIISLAQGCSGVRRDLVDTLLCLFSAGAYPVIPSQGSVGASGDLAPLGHLSGALMGLGEIRIDGRSMPARDALARVGLEPMTFRIKEGLALLNGTQVSTALALEGLFASERLLAGAVCAGALSLEAALGSHTPFDARIHQVRRQKGQIDIARAFRHLLCGGVERTTYAASQDPYCLRCQPQVLGACLDSLRHAGQILEREANAVTDNPINIPGDDVMLSGGNFHAEPVAMVADAMAVCIAEIGAFSERRIAFLVDANMSGLPAFLIRDGGVNSGFMTAQITAAALASENKTLAHPASVDSIPTTANQEDHVSMATFAARRLKDMARNSQGVLAIELLCAAQGVELRDGSSLPATLQGIMDAIRARADHLVVDRPIAPDIEAMRVWLSGDEAVKSMPDGVLASDQKGVQRRA